MRGAHGTSLWKQTRAVGHRGRSVQQRHLDTQRPAENTGFNSPGGMEKGNLGKKPKKYTFIEVFGLVLILFLSLKTADLNTWSGDPEVFFEGL